jgi:hypothetical protein
VDSSLLARRDLDDGGTNISVSSGASVGDRLGVPAARIEASDCRRIGRAMLGE